MAETDEDAAPVRPGEELDWAAIEAHLRAHLPTDADLDLGGPMTVAQFPHGSANLTYLLRFGDPAAPGAELVLRRPPFGVVAPGAHDMRREFRVLSRLWRVFDRAPRAYLLCDDHTVCGADFVVMERRAGVVVRDELPAAFAPVPDAGRRVAFALVDAMADLHTVDVAAAGLGDLGRPEGFVARQVEGWRTRWGLVRPDDAPEAMDRIPERLAARLPAPTRVSLVHNDLKLDNCQFDPSDPDRVRSIFDWDMTTVGDPLIDLGTLLNYWPDPDDAGVAEVARTGRTGMLTMGLPRRYEIVARYAERTGTDLSGIGWYEAFALWKTGVVVQQLHNRWKRGESTDERMATIAERMPGLARMAEACLDTLEHGGAN